MWGVDVWFSRFGRATFSKRGTTYLQPGALSGKSEALALAREIRPTYLLVDEAAARQKAHELGLPVIGSVGTLMQAKAAGLIPTVKPLLDAMIREAGFWINSSFYRQVLTQVGEEDVNA